ALDVQAYSTARVRRQLVAEEEFKAHLKMLDEEKKAKHDAAGKERVAAEARKKVQQQAIDDLTKSGALDADAAKETAEVDKEGVALDVGFQRVRKRLQDEILTHMQAAGIATKGAEEAANAAAEQLTAEQFSKQQTRQK